MKKQTIRIDHASIRSRTPIRCAALKAVLKVTESDSRPGWVPVRPARVLGADGGMGRIANFDDLDHYRGPLVKPDSVAPFPNAVLLLESGSGYQLEATHANLTIPDWIRERQMLIIGRNGSGKTTKIGLPMIWSDIQDVDRSVIVVDAKGDQTGPVIEMVKKARGESARILYLSFSEPEKSLAWNPFQGATKRSECREIAKCLSAASEPTEQGDSKFFRLQAEKVISTMMAAFQARPELSAPAFMQSLFDLSPSALVSKVKELGVGAVTTQIAMAAGENKNAETTLLECQNYLAPFAEPDVAATTRTSEFDFDALLDEPTVLILRFPEGVERLKPLHSIFIKRLFSWVAETADSTEEKVLPRPISCFIDEFASALNRLPDIERTINTFRSRKFSFVAAVQSLSQLQLLYGSHAARVLLEGFGSMIVVPPVGIADAQVVSERSGLMQITHVETSGDADGTIIRECCVTRNVLSEGEIAVPSYHPQRGAMISILLPELPPMLAFLEPIWSRPEFLHWDRETGAGPVEQIPERETPLTAPEQEVPLTTNNPISPGISDTRGWSESRLQEELDRVKERLDWENTTGSARKWWEAFEAENKTRMQLVLRLAEELQVRKATITEFFLAYVYSNTDNIQANLSYLDYTRLKKEEERRRREAAQRQPPPADDDDDDEDDFFERMLSDDDD